MHINKKIIFMIIALPALNLATFARTEPNVITGKHSMSAAVNSQVQNIQSNKVTGVVTDAAGMPVVGASVAVKGTNNGVLTDFDGKFSIEVPENGRIEISYVGFETQTIDVKGRSSFNVKLIQSTGNLEEVVVTGYVTQKKKNITGSVATMKFTEDVRLTPTTAVGNLLSGRMAGVSVSNPQGIPGQQPSITIRTGSSFNAQNVLYVIDGAIRGAGDFNNLAANEIETISVLKDAAAAAVYGSRSAGGVIVVTTRKGEIGKMKIDYAYTYGQESRTEGAELTSGVRLGQLYNRMFPPTDPGYHTQKVTDHLNSINGGWGYDGLGELWHAPTIKSHNFGLSGGSDKIKYFAGVSNVMQTTFLESYNYEKTNVRFNTTVKVTDDLQFFAGMSFNKTHSNADHLEGPNEMYRKLNIQQPWVPWKTDKGRYIWTGWAYGNVAGESKNMGGYVTADTFKPTMNVDLTYKIPYVPGLSAKASYAGSWTNSHNDEYGKFYDMVVVPVSEQGFIYDVNDDHVIRTARSAKYANPYLYKKATWSNDYQLNFQLSYDHTFDKHAVQGSLIYEKFEAGGAGVYGAREKNPVYATDQFWAFSSARADDWAGGDTSYLNGRKSFVGQFSYAYDNKYLATFNFREDGSMNFAEDNQWGFFPGGSVGWVLSEENFFSGLKESIQRVKLRASAGLTGNDAVGGWQWQESYAQGNTAYYGTTPTPSVGLRYGSIINPNITWEKTLSYNIGIDVDFLKHWNTTFEYWMQDTYDILGGRVASVPTSFSGSLPAENYGEVKSQGYEFSLGYSNSINKFNYYGNFNVSYGWNKVVTQDYATNSQEIDIPVGKSRNRIIGYAVDQFLRSDAEAAAYIAAHPGYKIDGYIPAAGMIVYKDISGPNGIPDNVINSFDRVTLKDKNNPVNYGLNLGGSYKGFTVDATFSGSYGSIKSMQEVTGNVEWNRMYDKWVDDSWTPENPNATLPKSLPYYNSASSIYRNYASEFWYKDNNYVRLKFLNVGYDFKALSHLKGLSNLKLFVSGTNLFVLGNFTKYWDPEGGAFSYPIMKQFSVGLNVGF